MTATKQRKRFYSEAEIIKHIDRAKKNAERWAKIAAEYEAASRGAANSYNRLRANNAMKNVKLYEARANHYGAKLAVFRTPLLPGIPPPHDIPR